MSEAIGLIVGVCVIYTLAKWLFPAVAITFAGVVLLILAKLLF